MCNSALSGVIEPVMPGFHHPLDTERDTMYTTSEAPPRIAKSMGASHGPCGLLSASSRRDSRSAGRPPPSAAPNRATKAAVVVPPIVAGQAVKTPVWERTKRTLPSPGNLAQVSVFQRPRGASRTRPREPLDAVPAPGGRRAADGWSAPALARGRRCYPGPPPLRRWGRGRR